MKRRRRVSRCWTASCKLLAEHAEFAVTVNSVLGSPVRNPQDALTVAQRARALGFTSTVGILHDGDGQLRPLAPDQAAIYRRCRSPGRRCFHSPNTTASSKTSPEANPIAGTAGPEDGFSTSARTAWSTTARSSAAGPGIPLEQYGRADLIREAAREKPCAPYCTVSCVHQTAMLDSFPGEPETGAGRNDCSAPGTQSRLPAAGSGECVDVGLSRRPVKRVLSQVALRILKARS